jgi:hypothetical protein
MRRRTDFQIDLRADGERIRVDAEGATASGVLRAGVVKFVIDLGDGPIKAAASLQSGKLSVTTRRREAPAGASLVNLRSCGATLSLRRLFRCIFRAACTPRKQAPARSPSRASGAARCAVFRWIRTPPRCGSGNKPGARPMYDNADVVNNAITSWIRIFATLSPAVQSVEDGHDERTPESGNNQNPSNYPEHAIVPSPRSVRVRGNTLLEQVEDIA